jgi:hypothetical protein
MTSAINPANPVHGNPTTESVRNNFEIAAQEISDLQTQLAGVLLNMPYLPLGGSAMTGPLLLSADPAVDAEAATKAYVDALGALTQQLVDRVTAVEKILPRLIGTTSAFSKEVNPIVMLDTPFRPLDPAIVDDLIVRVTGSGWPSIDGRSFSIAVVSRPVAQFRLIGGDTSAETGTGAGAAIWLLPEIDPTPTTVTTTTVRRVP